MERYIKQLLFEYDCVIVPGFGGFLTQYISAEIHPITHKFTPPSKRVAFNEQLKNNDGLLVTYIAEKESVSREEALNLINEFTKTIFNQLSRVNFFELKDIGRLFYNTHNQLEFEPDTTVNYCEESYGLSELYFKPIERSTSTVNKPSESKKAQRALVKKTPEAKASKGSLRLTMFSIVILVIGGAAGFFYFNKDNQELASINPITLFYDQSSVVKEDNTRTTTPTKSPKVEIEKAPEAEVPAAASEEVATTVEEPKVEADVITAKTERYFLVAGSFKSKENAEKLKEKFENENQEVSIIEPSNDKELFRVSIAEFDNKEVASSKMKELKDSKGYALWLLKQ